MRIKGKEIVIYVVKVYKNVTFVVAYNTEKARYATFEISSKYNEADKIIKMFKHQMYFFVGYGNKHYDNIFVNFLIKKQDHIQKMGCSYITNLFYNEFLSKIKRRDWDDTMIELKYAQNFDFIDLDMTLSAHYGHRTLHEQCFVNDIPCNVEIIDDDYVAFDDFDSEIEKLKERSDKINDILRKNINAIDLRLEMFNTYHSDVLDSDDYSALNTILLDKYQEQNGVKYSELLPTHTITYETQIKNIISNDIKFQTDEFNDFLEQLKLTTYSSSNPIIRKFVSYESTDILFATNGVECENHTNIFKSSNTKSIYMLTVESLEASVCLRYGIYPEKLVDKHENAMLFRHMFDDFLVCAIQSPEGSNRKDTFKKGLEEIISRYSKKNSWLYDPAKFASVKINSNLLLMMLLEELLIYGASIILVEDNTIVFSSFVDLGDVINKWSKQFGFTCSICECKKFFKYSVYDYVALDMRNNMISNGFFEEREINSTNSNIVIKAVKSNILYNIDIEDTIRNCGNISDFLMYYKITAPKEFMYKGIRLGREVIFYITSTPLPTLYIEEPSTEKYRTHMRPLIKGVSIATLEKYMLNGTKEVMFNIDYDFYINKAKALVEEIKTVQTIISTENNEETSDDTENSEN